VGDLLHPSEESERRKHKLKRLVPSPNSYFMDVKCPGCFTITTVFSHVSYLSIYPFISINCAREPCSSVYHDQYVHIGWHSCSLWFMFNSSLPTNRRKGPSHRRLQFPSQGRLKYGKENKNQELLCAGDGRLHYAILSASVQLVRHQVLLKNKQIIKTIDTRYNIRGVSCLVTPCTYARVNVWVIERRQNTIFTIVSIYLI